MKTAADIFRSWRLATAAMIACALPGTAATVPVSFEFDNLIQVNGTPTMANPRVPTLVTGTGSFNPFGPATLNAPGALLFGAQGPVSFEGNFRFTFDAGILSGTVFVDARALGNGNGVFTVLSGTGIFNDATGVLTSTGVAVPPAGPGELPGNHVLGAGTLTAPQLTQVPEPGSIALLGSGLASLMGIVALRKRQLIERCRGALRDTWLAEW